MLNASLKINGVFYAAGTAIDALPAAHIERLKRRGFIELPKKPKETKPKLQDLETKEV